MKTLPLSLHDYPTLRRGKVSVYYFCRLILTGKSCLGKYCLISQKKLPFNIARENVELMHECFNKHLRLGTARRKQDKDTEEELVRREE